VEDIFTITKKQMMFSTRFTRI